jgi:hypothetical protein
LSRYLAPEPSAFLTKLIRCKTTNRFLAHNGEWTVLLRDGFSFQDFAQVRETVAKLRATNVEIYHAFGSEASHLDFVIPLP